MKGGACDYGTLDGVRSGFFNISSAGQNFSGAREGWEHGPFAYSTFPRPAAAEKGGALRDLVDGTSNTILVGEQAGRNLLYHVRTLVAASNPEAQAQSLTGSGAWADTFQGDTWIDGRLYNGPPNGTNGGPCCQLLECTHRWSVFVARGGAQIALCDGSVRFISQNIAGGRSMSLITARGNEVVGEYKTRPSSGCGRFLLPFESSSLRSMKPSIRSATPVLLTAVVALGFCQGCGEKKPDGRAFQRFPSSARSSSTASRQRRPSRSRFITSARPIWSIRLPPQALTGEDGEVSSRPMIPATVFRSVSMPVTYFWGDFNLVR